jgi:OPA family glycerol-3-phosphate transporter-like MFS transporter/OPA family sugar phosphate sensor protein UhpC-like MFS transporter
VRDWRLCFYVPAAISLFGSLLMALLLRDTPESLGLPPVENTGGASRETDTRSIRELVFRNPYIWVLGFANFFVYTVRYGILDWGPTFLKQARHIDLTSASWMVAAFEGSGAVGMLTSGWLTDHVFGGRGARTCLFYMILCMISLLCFWCLPNVPLPLSTALLCTSGFLIYGPQALVGIAAANLATKHAASSAIGLTGLFAYLSTVISGVGIGWLVERRGWDAGFLVFVIADLVGVLLFALCWPAHADGYLREESDAA